MLFSVGAGVLSTDREYDERRQGCDSAGMTPVVIGCHANRSIASGNDLPIDRGVDDGELGQFSERR